MDKLASKLARGDLQLKSSVRRKLQEGCVMVEGVVFEERRFADPGIEISRLPVKRVRRNSIEF